MCQLLRPGQVRADRAVTGPKGGACGGSRGAARRGRPFGVLARVARLQDPFGCGGAGTGGQDGWVGTRRVEARVAVGHELLIGDRGGSGGGPRGPARRRTAEEDGDEGRAGGSGEQSGILEVLVKAGASMSDLPKDLQIALREGLLSIQDIQQWLTLAATPFIGSACKAIPGVRDRVMGNPRFVFQCMLELALGVTAKTIAEVQARGDNFFKEVPFVLSDLALEVLGDLSMVWLLSPRRSFKQPPVGGLARKIAFLPGHCYQAGNFSLGQRAVTIMYRGTQFFLVGFTTSVVGHSMTKWAVEKNAKGLEEATHLAPVLDNSLGWGGFMALSSNMRYQLVNGIEERVLDVFVPNRALNSLATLGIRFTNCFAGGVHWVWFARRTGLQ